MHDFFRLQPGLSIIFDLAHRDRARSPVPRGLACGGRDISVDRARDFSLGGYGFDPRSLMLEVGVSIM